MLIWTISLEGNNSTERQVTALAAGLRRELGRAEIRSFFPAPLGGSDLTSTHGATSTELHMAEQMAALGMKEPWPDLVVSCRPEVNVLALSVKKASGGKTKVIHIQNPHGVAGNFQSELSDFDLVVRQPHEEFEGANDDNVLSTRRALHGLTPALFAEWRQEARLASQPLEFADPLIVLVGGSDEHVTLSGAHYESFGEDLAALAQGHQGTMIVLTSRRTGAEAQSILKARLADQTNALVDPPIDYSDALTLGHRFIITSESLSMVSEALATGKPCALYNFDGYLDQHPLHGTFKICVEAGEIGSFPLWPAANDDAALHDELPALAERICAKLRLHGQPRP